MEWLRRLTGLHIYGGGEINSHIEKVKSFPWYRSKSVFFYDGHYYPVGNMTIPKNIWVYFLKGATLGGGKIFNTDDNINPTWWGAK